MRILFGTDGIRGVAGTELSAEQAFRVGNAIAQLQGLKIKESREKTRSLFIAKDTRISCDMLESAVAAGASAAGMNVSCCGVLPTPALAMITHLHQSVGVMISASHNSYEYNGLKVIRSGFKLPDEEEEKIEDIVLSGSIQAQTHEGIGRVLLFPEARGEYIRRILQMFADTPLSWQKPATQATPVSVAKPFRVVLDPSNGAACKIAPEVLRVLGAEVTLIHDEPDGFNINLECGSQHPQTLVKKVLETHADIGIAYDGDADRCILVDETGHIIDGDKIMAATAEYYLSRNLLSNHQIIATVMSNLGLEVYLKEKGIQLIRTRVGDRYVLEKMLSTGAMIGGEQSGHVIFLDRSTTGDGLVTSLTVLETMRHFNQPLSQLVHAIPEFPQVLRNIKVKDQEKVMECEELKDLIERCKVRLGEEGRILLRPSGTEPLIRIMVEGKEMSYIQRIVAEIADVVIKNNA